MKQNQMYKKLKNELKFIFKQESELNEDMNVNI